MKKPMHDLTRVGRAEVTVVDSDSVMISLDPADGDSPRRGPEIGLVMTAEHAHRLMRELQRTLREFIATES